MAHSLLCLVAFLPLWATAEYAEEKIGCTAIAIDGSASADGSAFAGMNADSGNIDSRLTYVPARHNIQEATREVFTFDLAFPRFVGYYRGEFYEPKPGQTLRVPVGHMPQVKSTFGYYESAEPLMNDQGVGMGESSCAAMLQNKFAGDDSDKRDVPTGMLDTVTLMQIAMERCATARCAVETMGAISEEFGFVPTPGEPVVGSVRGRVAYDDAGEAYTIADATGEAWVFHVLGGVTGITKSVWVAQKVPKGHFATVANDFTIGVLPEEPNEEFLFNKHAREAAIAAKLWDGNGEFHFSNVFVPEQLAFESPSGSTPIPLYAALRRWGLMSLLAPSLKLQFKQSNRDLPFSVKVESKVSHRDAMGLLRYHYQGTEFDMTQGILAGPFSTPFRIEGGPASGQIPRGIAILRTGYSIIAQTGPQKQVAWFAMDTPLTSVYVPLHVRGSSVSEIYGTGHQQEFTRDSASWAFNFVCNYMQLNYHDASQQDVYPAIETWQNTIDEQLESMYQADTESLMKWQNSLQEKVIASWWKLADHLVVKYNDGYTNVPTLGKKHGYPQWFADMIGFTNDVHPKWVQSAEAPPSSFEGYVPPSVTLPKYWDGAAKTWSMALDDIPLKSATPTQLLVAFSSAILAVSFGFISGRNFERSKKPKAPSDDYSQMH